MPFALQAKLLRVLQSGEVMPLGAENEIKIDTWIIATTNQELEKQIANQRFREDLYYRLNTISIYIPPLRDRPEDIPLLIEYYTSQYASKYLSKETLDAATIQGLSAYSWPGNVRELQNVLKRILAMGNSEKIIAQLNDPTQALESFDIDADHILESSFIQQILDFEKQYLNNNHLLSLKDVRKKAIGIVEKEVISNVLEKTGGNKSKASRILGVSYKTLLSKIKALDIS